MERMSVSSIPARGCGSRKTGGLYVCTGTSDEGAPIEWFVVDPVKAFEGMEPFRAPIVFEHPESGISHLLIWVGKEFYPSPLDYVEETRRLGASRRIPKGSDLSALEPGKSRMVLIHPYACTERRDEIVCPQHIDHKEGVTACFWAHERYLESLTGCEGGKRVIGSTSYRYDEKIQIEVSTDEFRPGVFLQLPITHFEYMAEDAEDEGPDVLVELDDHGFRVVILDEEGEV